MKPPAEELTSPELRSPWDSVVNDARPGASVVGVERLGGGAAATTYALDTTEGPVVVKRYGARQSDTVRLEWERLSFAQLVAAPVPRPLAVDLAGSWLGAPALAMSRLDGHLDLTPADEERWLRELAGAAATMHTTDVAGAAGALLRPSVSETWRPPTLRRSSPVMERAVEAIRERLPTSYPNPVLLHGDFHPANVLWVEGKLTGIVDWSGARLGPAACDLAYCRADVALMLGVRAAGRLTDHYVTATGSEPRDLALFDLVWGLDCLRKMTRVLRGHRQQGRSTTPRQFTARGIAFLQQALHRLERC